MKPGPNQVIACPYCEGLARYGTLLSGNTFGAQLWSDGKRIAPMLPEPPLFVRCRQCEHFYWLDDAGEVGVQDYDKGSAHDPAWDAAEFVREPSEAEYYEALGALALRVNTLASEADRRDEKNLRILAWWRSNDRFRNGEEPVGDTGSELSEPARANMEALAALLDETLDNECLMKVEVCRELGQTQAAQQLLSRLDEARYSQIVPRLRALCESGDTQVRELRFD